MTQNVPDMANLIIWSKIVRCRIWLVIFSCPSSSIPTLVTHSLTDWLCWIQLQNFDQTIPNQKLWNLASEFWPNFQKFYHIFSEFWPIFRVLTKFQNFDKISQFWPNITILTKFHNFGQGSQFPWFFLHFLFYQISLFRPNFN